MKYSQLFITGAVVLARLGWESNIHRDALEHSIKKNEDFPPPRSSSPFQPPQIVVRSPRSRSSTEVRPLTPSRRRSSSSGLSKSSESVARTPIAVPKLRRTKSSTALFIYTEPRRISHRESEELQPRHERAVTGDSVFTSGLGSLSEESATEVVGRKPTVTLDCMVGEWESRPRTSTIVYCLNQGLVATKTNLVMQGTVSIQV
ncbi:unnamed protein product [Cylicostephanus goldi]|uniref:Uncharacterized protein n=1 Tax=Cylicostephanus goldi TaxID=71465 RepID=A0A3P6S1U2_CYLGO|nr:unnamed protein product [Cylicostephanus goldi]